ncbi:MAG: ABC transporter ATP-binding protein [Vicinamibacteria bacterium]|nr:ABC transporter ATP-binding protein [Vicinamibacteria bacterium]
MEPALETIGLTYRYGDREAVCRLDLRVGRGEVFGFVGPNGAGKTTTIKLLLGLLTPAAGSVRVLGRALADDRPGVLRRVGTLVETPALYGHLTAEENLDIQRVAFGVARHRVAAALDETGLGPVAGRRVRHLSLGMRQRLGLAMALLHEPELLVLDEPANGLDPAGIVDLRTLLWRLAAQRGVTVFLSSHILAELEQTVSRLAVIRDGRLRYQGTLDELRRAHPGGLRITADDPARAAEVLHAEGHAVTRAEDGSLRLAVTSVDEAARLNARLVHAGLAVHELRLSTPSLEDIYLRLMADAGEVGR